MTNVVWSVLIFVIQFRFTLDTRVGRLRSGRLFLEYLNTRTIPSLEYGHKVFLKRLLRLRINAEKVTFSSCGTISLNLLLE